MGAATLAAGAPCDAETVYHCARVEEDAGRPSGRVLRLERLRHSYVDLEDPTHLEFDYTRWMGAAIDDMPAEPLEAVFIGGGGFTLPRYVAATRPGSRSRVLEVDGDLVELARERLGLRTGPDLRVRVGDARVTLRGEPTDSADLVVGDAFGGVAVPWHLTTVEFAARHPPRAAAGRPVPAQRHRLRAARPRPRRGRHAARGVRATSRSSGIPTPGGNHVFLASDAPLPELPAPRARPAPAATSCATTTPPPTSSSPRRHEGRGRADRGDERPGDPQPADHRVLLAARGGRRAPGGANWCTFATWASRQAGRTIRGEDLLYRLQARAAARRRAAAPDPVVLALAAAARAPARRTRGSARAAHAVRRVRAGERRGRAREPEGVRRDRPRVRPLARRRRRAQPSRRSCARRSRATSSAGARADRARQPRDRPARADAAAAGDPRGAGRGAGADAAAARLAAAAQAHAAQPAR